MVSISFIITPAIAYGEKLEKFTNTYLGGDNKICSFTFITLNLVWVLYKDIITLTEGETSK